MKSVCLGKKIQFLLIMNDDFGEVVRMVIVIEGLLTSRSVNKSWPPNPFLLIITEAWREKGLSCKLSGELGSKVGC